MIRIHPIGQCYVTLSNIHDNIHNNIAKYLLYIKILTLTLFLWCTMFFDIFAYSNILMCHIWHSFLNIRF